MLCGVSQQADSRKVGCHSESGPCVPQVSGRRQEEPQEVPIRVTEYNKPTCEFIGKGRGERGCGDLPRKKGSEGMGGRSLLKRESLHVCTEPYAATKCMT